MLPVKLGTISETVANCIGLRVSPQRGGSPNSSSSPSASWGE